jgi:phage terminase large subunit GpA-like protein
MIDFDFSAYHAGLRPDSILLVSDWADANRILSQTASSEPGKFRTERTPYLKEIMDALSPSSPVEKVVFMKGSQIVRKHGSHYRKFCMKILRVKMESIEK